MIRKRKKRTKKTKRRTKRTKKRTKWTKRRAKRTKRRKRKKKRLLPKKIHKVNWSSSARALSYLLWALSCNRIILRLFILLRDFFFHFFFTDLSQNRPFFRFFGFRRTYRFLKSYSKSSFFRFYPVFPRKPSIGRKSSYRFHPLIKSFERYILDDFGCTLTFQTHISRMQ